LVKMEDIHFPIKLIQEGATKLFVPNIKDSRKNSHYPSHSPVFFNPTMELSRDVSVVVLRAYQKIKNELIVCEPMTGCGIRGIRFAIEVDGIGYIVLNDINSNATLLAKLNVRQSSLSYRIIVKNKDANTLLSNYSSPENRFNVVDIDPFGSPSPYIDPAVRSLCDGGIIALTATDMAPLCGVHPKACFRKYLGKPLRTEYCHELAVRLLINCLVLSIARHNLGINVLFCHSTDHYIRVYAQINYGTNKANESIEKLGYILHCFNCFNRQVVSKITDLLSVKCELCGCIMDVAGPLWIDKLFNKEFCTKMVREIENIQLGTRKRLEKILNNVLAEIDAPPTYYVIDRISKLLGVPSPPKYRIIKTLLEQDFQATPTHFNPRGIRSNASVEEIKFAINHL
jgi:tRNA (guanine26-N2/guanine27-N2)-dimethyltransferase